MKALRIATKDKSWVIALDHPGVLNATVNCIDLPERQLPDHVELILGGLDCETNAHIRWKPHELRVGDTVTIEVIEDCDGDRPDDIEHMDLRQDQEQRMQYIRDEAAKLGWSIQEPE
jgi:hypothetical protein